jgi:endonuclease/exonuclease/phosphatase family metal-dependent hydrolase
MKFSLLTLNVWGAPYAQHRASRMRAIAQKIRHLNPDIVCFQEVYLPDDRRLLQHNLPPELEYQVYFPSGLLGSGLLTVSRYPIIETAFHRFRLGGKPEDIKRGDYYAGKGVGLTRIQTPAGIVDVYNIHPHAQYKNTPNNEYAVYTGSNLYEAARFIHTHSPYNPVILAGDYNTQPHEAGYRLITTLTQLVDTDAYLHPEMPGLTFVPDNPYVKSPPQRLDYVMVKRGLHTGFDLLDAAVVLSETLSGENGAKAYSDHYGVWVTLEIVDAPAAVLTTLNGSSAKNVLDELAMQLRKSVADTTVKIDSHTEKMLLGLASLLDAGFTLRLLLRWLPGWRNFRNGLFILALLYTLYQAFCAGVLLQARKQTLTALLQEVELQLRERRAFNEMVW